jgi:hypothetical protein
VYVYTYVFKVEAACFSETLVRICKLQVIILQKMYIFIVTNVRISNLWVLHVANLNARAVFGGSECVLV